MKTLRYKNFVEENYFKEFCSSLLLLRDLLKKKFTNFISDEKNKDKIVKIDGIMQK